MIKFFITIVQFIIILLIVNFAIQNSQTVSFTLNDIIIQTSTTWLIISFVILIFIILIIQRVFFFFKQSALKIKINREKTNYKKGYEAFLNGIVALANHDYKKASSETRVVNKYFKDDSLSLFLKSETLKIEKKFDELNIVYEKMIENKNTSLLGIRGLMEQYLRNEDYHHALIYGERLFLVNPRIEKLYSTLINIIGKTQNWQKLIQINESSVRQGIIDKKIFNQNQSIAYYEIARIKYLGDIDESIKFIDKAIKLRGNFPPYISFYIDLLIRNNNLEKARKLLKKTWTIFPHPVLKNKIKDLAKVLNISFYQLTKEVIYSSKSDFQSKILLAESLIEKNDWSAARDILSSLLQHKPSQEVCLLMSKIEDGYSGDTAKVNAWITRSNNGELSKIWVCSESGVTQIEWSSVSDSGYFNSLVWKIPNNTLNLGFEMNPLRYIDNA